MRRIVGVVIFAVGVILIALGALKIFPGVMQTGIFAVVIGAVAFGLSFIKPPNPDPSAATAVTL